VKQQKPQGTQKVSPQQEQKPQKQQGLSIPPKKAGYEPDTWDAEVLGELKYFTIVLLTGEKIKAKFLGTNRYNIRVETEDGELLIPKHAIKYYILKEYGEEG
jgi:sRNA-binding regulator protein Hfq